MADNLVKRLLCWEEVWPEDFDKEEGHLYYEAADRIEALERERDDARTYAAEVRIREKRAEDARITAEARLAKAVEALQAFKAFDEMPTRYKRPDVFEVSVRRKLLSTLAEIEGGKKDE